MTQHDKKSDYFSNLQIDYAAWMSQVILSAFYDLPTSRREIIVPPSFRSKNKNNTSHQAMIVIGADAPPEETTDDNQPPIVPDRVADAQDVLHELATRLLTSETPPPRQSVETFLAAHESFQQSLQRLERDSLLENSGIDAATGLRSESAMMLDLERELQRRARRGQPFCIVLSKIDGEVERQSHDNMLAAATVIKKIARSFDDIYITSRGEFLSSLKHSDDKGGIRFAARLAEALKDNEVAKFTMSSCVAEPIPGDVMKDLIQNVSKDLEEISKESKGVAAQYAEISVLERYIKSLDTKDKK